MAVGALLWPLAKPKSPAKGPGEPVKVAVSSPKKQKTGPQPEAPDSEKSDQLTFFQTLKEEGTSKKEDSFVPFKPKGDAPPPLEALAADEAEDESSEAAEVPVEESPLEAAPEAPSLYYVQVAAFQYGDNARRLTGELRRGGYQAYAVRTKAGSKPHLVRVGPFESPGEAHRTARHLEETFLYPTSVHKASRP